MNKFIYTNFDFIDGTGRDLQKNQFLVVENGVVVETGPMAECKGEGQVVDLSGKTLMPGLINAHVHVTMEPIADPFTLLLNDSIATTTLRGAANLKKHLYAGTTFFRDVGAGEKIDLDLRDAVNKGDIEGPEFQASGRVITMTGGHGWVIGAESDGCDEVRKNTRSELKNGVDLIKIMATGGVMTKGVKPGSPQLSLEEMTAAVEEAHKAEKKTASHAQGTEGIKNAVLAGIDSIEHGIFLDDEVIQLMVERGTYLVPTLVAPFFIVENGVEAGIPKDVVDKANGVMEAHQNSFRAAHKAGVKIAMGTDAGTPFNLHDKAPYELKLMVECGMTPMEAVVASTYGSADLMGILDNYGTLEKGKFADFLVLNENPLENLDTLFDIADVYKKGKKIKRF